MVVKSAFERCHFDWMYSVAPWIAFLWRDPLQRHWAAINLILRRLLTICTGPSLFFLGEKSGFKDPLHLGHLQSSIVTICAPVADRQRRSPSGWYTCKNLADLCALYSACYSVLLPFPIIFIFLLFLILSSSCKVTRDEKQKGGKEASVVYVPFSLPCKKKKKKAFSTRLEW